MEASYLRGVPSQTTVASTVPPSAHLSSKTPSPGSRGGGGAAPAGSEDPSPHHSHEDRDPGKVAPLQPLLSVPSEQPLGGLGL